jgi:GNAT superfamily N-acetyltransferase
MIEIRQADLDHDRRGIEALWVHYLSWANEQLEVRYGFRFPIEEALQHDLVTLTKFHPPDGRLLLTFEDHVAVGTACLRRIATDTAEIKRMYVLPSHRGRGLGRSLLNALTVEAEASGYKRVRLDSARFMEEAHALYRRNGFVDIAPYPESEIPDHLQAYWLFMERRLG